MMSEEKRRDLPIHDGEREMAKRYPNPIYQWDNNNIGMMIRSQISPRIGAYLESLPFFFIATSNATGHCDASFRGREMSVDGPLPLCWVPDSTTLIFPDFSGNGLYQSLGNILQNPQIGMLFMDFERQSRLRINGRATVHDADGPVRRRWPGAQAYVKVEVEQAYGNCQARIPHMRIVPGSEDPFF